MAKENVYAVFGLGAFGTTLCAALGSRGDRVVAIDRTAEAVERASGSVYAALLLDSTDEAALRKAPLDEVDVAFVTMGDDIEASVLTTALLKRRGIPYIVARATKAIHKTVLEAVGANEVVLLEEEGAMRVAQRILAPRTLDSIALTGEFNLAEWIAPASFVGSTLKALKIREKFDVTVVAVKRVDLSFDDQGNPVRGESLTIPYGDLAFEEGDVVFLLGKRKQLDDLMKVE